MPTSGPNPGLAQVSLYWLPLGAGDNTHCVRTSGRIFEWIASRAQHRERSLLYHAALEVHLGAERFTIEMAPAWSASAAASGPACTGSVGMRWLGRSKLFRYEVRCCRDRVIPDVAEAVHSPYLLGTDSARAQQLLALVPSFPTATWGRDELGTGDMWTSNSLIAWLLARSGHDVGHVVPPERGRAPGWAAGLVAATRGLAATTDVHGQSRGQ